MDNMIYLAGLLPDEICENLNLTQKFRGKQIFQWISKGVSAFEDMTNIDKNTRTLLAERASLYSSSVTAVLKDPDGTIKLQITLNDGCAV